MEIQISVVIPVYNAENTINNCIESALKQDLESFEVILVNDGSNDSTSRILEQYSDNPQVKIFHQVNMGVSAARNLGLSHASGEYVFFLDSDDILDDGMLSKMYQFVKKIIKLISYLVGIKNLLQLNTVEMRISQLHLLHVQEKK